MRESPAVHIAREMLDISSAKILLVEPNINELPKSLTAGNLVDLDSAIEQADIVVILVGHSQFKTVSLPEDKGVIDAVGITN